MKKKETLVGRQFGKWNVIEDLGIQNHNRTYRCLCECGEVKIMKGTLLTTCNAQMCKKCANKLAATKHGYWGTKVYSIWKAMRKRCSNRNHVYYKDYGGRGIKVCERWQNSFEAFLEDMGEPPTPKHSLDRIEVDGNYCKDNCRWATLMEQANNRHNNTLIAVNGELDTIANWAKVFDIKPATIAYRIRNGWYPEDALSTPVNKIRSISKHSN